MKSKFLGAAVAACCAMLACAAEQPAPLRLEPKRASWFSRVKVCRNLAYGPRQLGTGAAHADVAQTYDLYLPAPLGKIPKTAPFFLCIHGGAWMYGSKDGPLPFFEGFVKEGFVVASMNYALCNKGRGGDHTFADMLADIDAMVSHLPQLAAALGIDIDRIALGGSSAGGHLALLYAYDGAKPSALGLNLAHAVPVACVFSDCGPTDISSPEFGVAGMGATKSKFATWNGNFGALSGAGRDYGTFTNLVSHLARYSPVNLVCKESPPTICLYGDIGTVPTSNTFVPVPGGETRPYTELWKMVGSSATPPAAVGTDGIVATQNYEALTNRLAAAGVPYAARIEKAGHCQILFRKPKTRPWLFENMKRYMAESKPAPGR